MQVIGTVVQALAVIPFPMRLVSEARRADKTS
jgi:hypothetical protein